MKKFLNKFWTSIKAISVKTKAFALHHKITSSIMVLVILGAGYWGYSAFAASNTPTQYVLGVVTKAPLNVTVTGSGQVSAQDTLNLTPQGSASGQITQLDVTPGQTVKAGQIIAELDMTTAAQAVTSAKQNLEGAQISYQQALNSSNSSVTGDQSSLTSAQATNIGALATTYANLSTVMNGLDSVLHSLSTMSAYSAQENIDAYVNFLNTTQSHTYHDQVVRDYTAAAAAYQKVNAEYAASNASTLTPAQIEQLDIDTVSTNTAIGTALRDTLIYYSYVNDQITSAKLTVATQLSSQITSLTSYQSSVTSNNSSILSAQASLVSAQQSMTQDTQSLGNGTVPLTVQSAELNVQKAQESLNEALTTESNYVVRAPFDGEIASVPVNKFDNASSGTTVATLITTDEYADLSLNETDAAKVKVGQPVSVTFDAITGFTMPGTVAIVNPVGTVSQGVVTYDVKISFSSQDSRIKPGMTAEAVITTASKASAIQVPSAAIKTQGNISYVQVATLTNASSTPAYPNNGMGSTTGTHRNRTASSTMNFASSTFAGLSGTTPFATRSLTVPANQVTLKMVPVTVGLSSDTMTEVLSGLTPGEYVVTATQTTSANTTKSSAASATSLLGGTGAGRIGGGGGFTGGGGNFTSGGARASAPTATGK